MLPASCNNLLLHTLVDHHYQSLSLPQPVVQFEQLTADSHERDVDRYTFRSPNSNSSRHLKELSCTSIRKNRILRLHHQSIALPLPLQHRVQSQTLPQRSASFTMSLSDPSSPPTSDNRITDQIDRRRRRARRTLARERISGLTALLQERDLPVQGLPAILRSCSRLIRRLTAESLGGRLRWTGWQIYNE